MKSFLEMRKSLTESFWLNATDNKKIRYNGDEPGNGVARKQLNRLLKASGGVVNLQVLEYARKKLKETEPVDAEFLDFLDDVSKTKSKKISPIPNRKDKMVWFDSLL